VRSEIDPIASPSAASSSSKALDVARALDARTFSTSAEVMSTSRRALS
jgi:hypothetical protein